MIIRVFASGGNVAERIDGKRGCLAVSSIVFIPEEVIESISRICLMIYEKCLLL